MSVKTIDFFVQPEYFKNMYPSEDVYEEYMNELLEKLEESQFPVLVSNGSQDRKFREFIDDKFQFSDSRNLRNFYKHQIYPNHWNRLKGVIDYSHEEIRFHGSSFGENILGLAEQVFLYKHCGNIFDDGNCDKSPLQRVHMNWELRKLENTCANVVSPVKYGTVLKGIEGRKIVEPNNVPVILGGKPFGNFHYQMIDGKSSFFSF